ncbi:MULTISPECIES: hypothetical protein [unclassified Paenibacillus]|uniref:hypothetical protein n=1 Tax=unclassified Paenibacillus TaxID=185978 RepID=UPI0009A73948|nr:MULTISPECIES: hypothetical protein [unclassified Paenibacillus]SLK13370.1 hypothetical protein SAMN06272722_108132 [Paenibacillus sp. RU5A]SOC73001.1 hypothetical protein SAMN05880581_108132 [Paenibacillus sp. RU26A]SOC75271.1 hypothetical protein SAMN05880586_108132 [Paenibacillus sp. RU5M]
MSINKRLGMESLLVTLLFTLGFMVWNVIQGMLMTLNHTPEMLNNASSFTSLESKVDFGSIARWDTTSILVAAVGFLLLAAAYYGLRSGIQRWTQRF